MDEFTINADETAVTRPNQVTRRVTANRKVIFGRVCNGCPLRAQCTTGRSGRTLDLHPQDRLLCAARRLV